MADLSVPAGFNDGDSFVYDGELASLPAWADKGWATYANGPALAVPKGDPEKGPYATDVARIGDTVLTNKKQDRFAVVPAQVIGDQPGDPDNPATAEKPLPTKPVGTEAASLEDLDKTGVLPFDQMNKEQQSQMIARGTAPAEAMKKAGLGPSGLAGGSYPNPAPEPEPAPTHSRRSRSHSEE